MFEKYEKNKKQGKMKNESHFRFPFGTARTLIVMTAARRTALKKKKPKPCICPDCARAKSYTTTDDAPARIPQRSHKTSDGHGDDRPYRYDVPVLSTVVVVSRYEIARHRTGNYELAYERAIASKTDGKGTHPM